MTRVFDRDGSRWSGLYEDSVRGGAGGDRYALFQEAARRRVLRRMRLAMEFLAPSRGERILDLGCGHGPFADGITREGACWVGLDISFVMLSRRRQEHPPGSGSELGSVNADARALPFRPGGFDGALCVGVMNFYPKEAWPQLLSELHDVLRPGGRAVLTSLRFDALTWLRSRAYPRLPPPFGVPGPLYPLPPRHISSLVGAAGFRAERSLGARKKYGLPHYTLFRLRRD